MKQKHLFLAVFFSLIINITCFGQRQNDDSWMRDERMSLSAGFMHGGGSLIGADFEVLFTNRIGMQLGAGISSWGAGINIHLKPCINSSFINFGYWHQGFSDNHFASWIGPMFVYRAKKIFQAGVGFGSAVSTGPNWNPNNEENPSKVSLLFTIGLYFPLR